MRSKTTFRPMCDDRLESRDVPSTMIGGVHPQFVVTGHPTTPTPVGPKGAVPYVIVTGHPTSPTPVGPNGAIPYVIVTGHPTTPTPVGPEGAVPW